jgi:hypothetical protein
MQERERMLRESSVSRPSVMVPIEFRLPPEHQVIIEKRIHTPLSSLP